MSGRIDRRALLGTAAGAGIALALPGCAVAPGAAPPLASTRHGSGPIEITIWVQDFAASIRGLRQAVQGYVDSEPAVSVKIQVIPYANLRAKVIPAVAAGSEAEIINAYNSWFVSADLGRMFLRLDEQLGGRDFLSRLVLPGVVDATAAPDGHVYGLPSLAGMRTACVIINSEHAEQAGVRPTTLRTWEDFIDAARELTVTSGGQLERAGFTPFGSLLNLILLWTWQTGGECYDRDQGRWTLGSDHGRAALQRIAGLFGPDPVCSYDLLQPTTMTEDIIRRRLSSNVDGVYQIGSLTSADPTLGFEALATPPLAEAMSDSYYGDEIAMITLSKRLERDPEKLRHCAAIVQRVLSADAMIDTMNVYSGTITSADAYADPRVDSTKYGALTKRLAEQIWPKIRFTNDRVADKKAAETEIDRGLRGEISLDEALGNAEGYLNRMEQLAYERQHQG
jgi:ABC-type glycerol-3-phosphate transport system substrate-binding protein